MIALFDGIRDTLQRRWRMIEFPCDFNSQLRASANGVIINRDPAIGRNELAGFGQYQRINLQRTRLDAARRGEQLSDRFIQLLCVIRWESARRHSFIDCRIQWPAIYIAWDSSRCSGALFDPCAA